MINKLIILKIKKNNKYGILGYMRIYYIINSIFKEELNGLIVEIFYELDKFIF